MTALRRVPRARFLLLAAVATAGATVMSMTSAGAAGDAYGTWTVAGANPSWTGTVSVPAAGFPPTTFATDSGTPTISSGASAFLGASTPFGAEFGSSQNQPYLSLRTAAGSQPSTTTFTFEQPVPGNGWGFALGDVDADQVHVQAIGADGQPVTTAELGWQSAFNYCQNTPKPSSCGSPTDTDVPTWNPTTSTLVGNGADTAGASGWFRPTVPISSLTLTFSRIIGIPIFQLWIAARTVSVSGTVTDTMGAGDPQPTASAPVALLDPAGDPVLGSDGVPVTTTTGTDGSWVLPDVLPSTYELRVEPPPGRTDLAATTVPLDATSGDVSGVAIALPPASPTTTTTTTTSSSTTSTTVAAASFPSSSSTKPASMARTGADSGPIATLGLLAIALGFGLITIDRKLRLHPR